MKCPHCNYEHVEEKYGVVEKERVITRGAKKGKTVIESTWGVRVEGKGDEGFETLRLVAVNHTGSCDVEVLVCPKCEIMFRNRYYR